MRHPLLAAAPALLAAALAGCAEPRFRGDPTPSTDTGAPSASRPETAPAGADPAPAGERPSSLRATRPADTAGARANARAALLADGADSLADDATGYFMDVQEAALRRQLAGHAVRLAREGDTIRLTLAGETAFATGSRQLAPPVDPILAAIAGVLTEYRATLVTVAAHTDPSGEATLNRELSRARAVAVARRLAAAGVDPRRIVAVGYGESRPAANDTSPGNRRPDRRVELLLEPLVRTAEG
ncbi:MAG: OmpA family protein [Halofilum sp. (in: g-proteobacteria)]|nr:OmpA family protein [Halofilum sp. (in: g-proteobacteria)]